MQKVIILCFLMLSLLFSAQTLKIVDKIVPAACGQCMFDKNEKKGCDLAVKIDGKVYFVKGTNIDDHGDAHAEKGFCNAIRKAQVSGEIKNGYFYASSFKIIREEK